MTKQIRAMPSFIIQLMDYAKNHIHSESDLENLMNNIYKEADLVLTAKSLNKIAAGTDVLGPDEDKQEPTGVTAPPKGMEVPVKDNISTPKELVQTMFGILEGKNLSVDGSYLLRALNTMLERMEAGTPVPGKLVEEVMGAGHKANQPKASKKFPVSKEEILKRPPQEIPDDAKSQEFIANFPQDWSPFTNHYNMPLQMNSLEEGPLFDDDEGIPVSEQEILHTEVLPTETEKTAPGVPRKK